MHVVLRVSLLTALLAACTAIPDSAANPVLDPTATVAVRSPETAAQPATPTAARVEATAIPSAPTAAAGPIDDAFRPSDPNSVVLAAGRPQLVEFYAVW